MDLVNGSNNRFFSQSGGGDISSITIRQSEINDISENVARMTQEFFGKKNYAYDDNNGNKLEEISNNNCMDTDEDLQNKINLNKHLYTESSYSKRTKGQDLNIDNNQDLKNNAMNQIKANKDNNNDI